MVCRLDDDKNPGFWHVTFLVKNYSENEVVVLGLTIKPSLNEVNGQPRQLRWLEGKAVLEHKNSFLGYMMKIPLNAESDAPSFAFRWHYRFNFKCGKSLHCNNYH